MKIKNERDFFSGLMFLALGVAFVWHDLWLSKGFTVPLDLDHYALVLSAALALLGALLVIKALALETHSGNRIAALSWQAGLTVGAMAIAGFFLARSGPI